MTAVYIRLIRPLIGIECRSSCSRYQCLLNTVSQTRKSSGAAAASSSSASTLLKVADENTSALDSILTTALDRRMNATNASRLINELNRLLINNAISVDQFQNHPGFLNVCEILGNGCNKLNHPFLLTSLRNIQHMQLSGDSRVVQSICTEVLWKIRKMSIKSLAYLLSFQTGHRDDGEIQQKLTKETIDLIECRWIEISKLDEMCLLLDLCPHFSPRFLGKLDDKIICFIEQANGDDIIKLFSALAKTKRRSTPLIRSMGYHLNRYSGKWNVKQITSILYAMKALNFPDANLLKRLALDLEPEINAIEKSSTIAAILTVIGQMRWKNIELLRHCTKWMSQHIDQCRTQDLTAYVMTCGRLNYLEKESKSLLGAIKLIVTKVDSPAVWLDVVWSLVVLKQAKIEHMASVFDMDITNFSPIQKTKLGHINAAARHEYFGSYKGPFLNLDPSEMVAMVPTNQDGQKLKLSIFDALGNFLPRGKFMTQNKHITDGIIIDAEFLMDKHRRPLPLAEYNMNREADASSRKPIPHGANKIALMIWHFKDLTLDNKHTGATSFTTRILRNLGYLVVEVPHFEFPADDSILKKVQFLQGQINNVIQEQTTRKN